MLVGGPNRRIPIDETSPLGNRLRFNEFVWAMNFSTDHDYSQVVSPESLERELKRVRAAAAGAEGVLGPRSLTWQIDWESAIFF
jgi:hypothetical protein